MRKVLLGLLGLVALAIIIPLALLASGTIDSTSIRMVLNVMTGLSGPPANVETVRQRYRVPAGFHLSLYAADLERARFLRVTSGGDLLVSRPHSGDIILLRRDADGDGMPDAQQVLLDGLQRPLGLDIHDGWLYLAQSDSVGRIRFDESSGQITGALEAIVEGLTDNGNHWSKTIRVGPDGLIYLAQGSTCNVCEEEDARRATMMRFKPDGSDLEIIATGLRNSVGFDWAPWDDGLYATDNGRDLLGDDFPPCELNKIETGHFYGWPYFNGHNIPDPDMGADPLAQERLPTAPVHAFKAHNAPLGITFLDAASLPDSYRRSALVALHGSWNRSSPDGYKVVSLHFGPSGIEERDFLVGFYSDDTISGRPVDVAQGPDGAIYISDDYAGAIYRVTYGETPAAGELGIPEPRPSKLDNSAPDWLMQADLPGMAANGKALYDRYDCASCHERGENPKRLDDLDQRLGYRAVINTLRAPRSPMPVYPLSEEEQRELAVFLLTGSAGEAR